MSTHRIEVVSVRLLPHPQADRLSIVRVFDYQVVVRTEDWEDGQLGAYIPPDYLVPANRSEFAFLGATYDPAYLYDDALKAGVPYYHVRVQKLRGQPSMGLLVKAPAGTIAGDNVIDQLGVRRYSPPFDSSSEAVAPPPGVYHDYDVEDGRRYTDVLEEGEEVVVTEKVCGVSARYHFDEASGQMFCGSRNEWREQNYQSPYWKTLHYHVELVDFCRANPNLTVYGEVYGNVRQGLRYGRGDEVRFICFDLLRHGIWVDHDEARFITPTLKWVPVLYRGPWSKDLYSLAEGKSKVAFSHGVDQIREGVVVKPVHERNVYGIGRVQLKLVSNDYLSKPSKAKTKLKELKT